MLLDSICDIFDQELSNSLGRFLVPDRGTNRDGLSVILLVESPHVKEVEPPEIGNRYPLAGATATSAGRHVRDKLAESQPNLPTEPIGSLVHQGCNIVRRLGIMNVCQLPFQRKAYGRHIPRSWNNYIKCMKTILGGPGARSRICANCRRLDVKIVEDLRGRLECLHRNNPGVLLVRCGGVAQAFYDKTGVDMPYCDLPHPTRRAKHRIGRRRGWLTLNHDESQCLQNIAAHLWPPHPGT